MTNKVYIYESPDKGKTVYRREFGSDERELIKPAPKKTTESVDVKDNDRD